MAQCTFYPNIPKWPRPKHGHVLDVIRPEAFALAEKFSHIVSEFSSYAIESGEKSEWIGIDTILPEQRYKALAAQGKQHRVTVARDGSPALIPDVRDTDEH
eukprot:9208987-Karenia_brevis.AAC.1